MSVAKLILGMSALSLGIFGTILDDPLLSYQGIITAIIYLGFCVDDSK